MSLLGHVSKRHRHLTDCGCVQLLSKSSLASLVLKRSLHSSSIVSNDEHVEDGHSRTLIPTWSHERRSRLYAEQQQDRRFTPGREEYKNKHEEPFPRGRERDWRRHPPGYTDTQDRHGHYPRRRDFEPRRRFNRHVQGELIYGIGPCLAALKAERRKIFTVYTARDREGGGVETIASLANEMNIEVQNDMTKREMSSQLLRTDGHQGVAMDATKLKFLPLWERDPSPDELNPNGKPPLWLLLNKIQDPMNLGAILRTSLFFGVQKVVTTKECSPLSPAVSKASAGTMEILPVYKALNARVLLETKREEGWDIIGTVGDQESGPDQAQVTQCENFVLQKPSVLVFGNEGFGIDLDLERLCTKWISIQSHSDDLLHIGLDSLNVSVSVGVLLYSLLRGNLTTLPGTKDD